LSEEKGFEVGLKEREICGIHVCVAFGNWYFITCPIGPALSIENWRVFVREKIDL